MPLQAGNEIALGQTEYPNYIYVLMFVAVDNQGASGICNTVGEKLDPIFMGCILMSPSKPCMERLTLQIRFLRCSAMI